MTPQEMRDLAGKVLGERETERVKRMKEQEQELRQEAKEKVNRLVLCVEKEMIKAAHDGRLNFEKDFSTKRLTHVPEHKALEILREELKKREKGKLKDYYVSVHKDKSKNSIGFNLYDWVWSVRLR